MTPKFQACTPCWDERASAELAPALCAQQASAQVQRPLPTPEPLNLLSPTPGTPSLHLHPVTLPQPSLPTLAPWGEDPLRALLLAAPLHCLSVLPPSSAPCLSPLVSWFCRLQGQPGQAEILTSCVIGVTTPLRTY